jgi:hypothetical protein
MAMRSISGGFATAALLAVALTSATPASAVVIDFEGLPAGTIVDNSLLPPGFTLEVTNGNPAHTPAAIIFDSSCPGDFCTGDDYDLKTPGAGVGNDTSQGKVLIIAENLVDANMDGLVDGPDDEAMGGTMLFTFPCPVTIESVRVTDIDTNELGSYIQVDPDTDGQKIMLQALGNNSGQTAVFVDPQPSMSMLVYFKGSGSIDDITIADECGNCIVEAGEDCDPPDGETCDENCMTIEGMCGDGVINQPSEECDGADLGDCQMGCESNCTCSPYCGDGNIDAGEECDGENVGECQMGCESNCTCTPYCGDGNIDAGEECDGANVGDCQMGCESDCTCTPYCGDGHVDAGEQCDPPNGTTCDENCMTIVPPMCGDNEINQPSEQCDGTDLGDCQMGCESNCKCTPYCGDDNVDPGEQCDPPDGLTCDENCMSLPYCGDDMINQSSETCDGTDADACVGDCRGDCTCCGDGVTQPPEQCDPPDGTTCDDTCMSLPYCGDNMINGDEECDGTDLGTCQMGCESDCTCTPYCGDGNVDPGEQCDPPDVGVEICNNDIDDDGDGRIDCRDTDCAPGQPQHCNGDCELVDPCTKFIRDPAQIKFDVTKDGVDFFKVHGSYHLRQAPDLGSEGFSLSISNANGSVYFAKLVPGELRRKVGGKGRYIFWDKGARDGGPGEADGLYRVVVRIRPRNGSLVCAFRVRAYGDFSAATEALMTTQVIAGANAASLTAEWQRTNHGWRLRQRDFD